MIKLMGSLLILAGGVLIRQTRLAEYRRRLRTLTDLASSLRRMSDEIRTLRRPLPELMRYLSGACGPEAGTFFKEAAAQAERGEDLSEVWRHLARALPLSQRDRAVLEEIFRVGTTLPKGVPRPVVNRIRCAPDAARSVQATMSLPGPVSRFSPFSCTCSPIWSTSLTAELPAF